LLSHAPQARLRARLAEHQSARASATAEAARREQLTASVRRQLEQLLGHAQKTQNLQLLLRKLKVVDAGPPMGAAELKESLKRAKVGIAYECVVYCCAHSSFSLCVQLGGLISLPSHM
jgi:hypothetical protein